MAGAPGVAGSGGAKAGVTTCGTAAPSPASGGANFPFPQHRAAGACFFPPSCADADMLAGWSAYKTALIVPDMANDGALRVKRPSDGNDTVSEGISYGMLFSVYMNDKTTFDGIWKYEQKHLDPKGLMHWKISASDTPPGPTRPPMPTRTWRSRWSWPTSSGGATPPSPTTC